MAQMLRWIGPTRQEVQKDPVRETWTVFYMAEMDTGDWYPDEVLNAPPVPGFLDKHPQAKRMFVINYRCEQNREVPNAAEVAVIYCNRYDEKLTYNDNPLLRPAKITWNTYKVRVPMLRDLDDVEIATTAGEPIPFDEEKSRRVIRIQKNISDIDELFATEIDFVNKDTVKIRDVKFDPETLWLTDVDISDVQNENGYIFYVLTFSLYHNPETWRRKVRNAGFLERKFFFSSGGTEHLQPGLQAVKVGKPAAFPSTPVPLDKRGLAFSLRDQFGNMVQPRVIVGQADENGTVTGMTKEQWKEAELKFRTRALIQFKGNIPLK